MSLDALEAIRTRRVTRFFSDEPVSQEILWSVLEAARWAPTASRRRVHRYVCITDRQSILQMKMVSPGIVGDLPGAIIVICIDWTQDSLGATDRNTARRYAYIDVGTAAQNMLLAAHALGLGAGPITSFSPEAVEVLLNIPPGLRPVMFIALGYPGEPASHAPKWPKQLVRVEDLVQWGHFPEEHSIPNSAST